MNIFVIATIAFRVVVTCVCVYKITRLRETMNLVERVGLGFTGSGSFMTFSVLSDPDNSPFKDWAVTVMTLGFLMFIAGRTWRDRRHARANEAQKERAREHLIARGRL